MKARSLRIDDAEYSAQVDCAGGRGEWSAWASAQLTEARRRHQSSERRKAGKRVVRKSERSARGLGECVLCRRFPWRLTLEISAVGPVFVVYCCDGIELPGAGSFDEAVELWNTGKLKRLEKKKETNHDKTEV